MIHRLIIAVEHPQKPRVVTPFPALKIMDLPQFQGDHKESLYRGTYRPNVYLGIRASMERVNYLKNDATRVTGVDKARGGLFGDFATSFDQLRWYLETAMRTNLGSVFELDVDESSGCFRRLFGRYKGHLLAATSKDGNQGLFPLAFAIAVDCFRESYKESIYPVPSSERFDFDGASSSVIKPPITKKQPGWNKKKRIPSRGENVKQIKCGRCLKYGNHNKKTCKAAI
ncbi:unnamed protein product [Camellia sinensis]